MASAAPGALLSMGFIPQPLPLEPAARRNALATLTEGALALVDVSWPSTHEWRRLDRLCRAWATGLGFAALVPEWNDGNGAATLRDALVRACAQVGVPPPAPEQLLPFSCVLSPDEPVVAARALVRMLTGRSPEAFVAQLGTVLDVGDRQWNLSGYPRCFVGSDAVEALVHALHRSRDEAVALGQALGELGLLVHVAHDHPFLDRHLYYRLAWSARADAVDAAEVWRTLERELPGLTDTRHHLGTAYPACFVGAEVVTLLARRFDLDRVDAWLLMHRMAQWGLVEHVTRSRPFIDGHFFYRRAGADEGAPAGA